MAVAQVGTTVISEVTTGTSVTVGLPAGAGVGHLLVVAIGYKTNTVMATPSGWTAMGGAGLNTAGVTQFYRWYGGSPTGGATEPASYTFTAPITDSVTAEMSAWSGVDTTTPLDVPTVNQTAASATSGNFGPITTVTANALILQTVIAQTTATAMTVSAGPTIVSNTSGTSRRVMQTIELKATPGASTARTYTTGTVATSKAGITNALRPSSTAAATAPIVSAGADASITVNTLFTRTATENDGGSAITSRNWTVISGPTGQGQVYPNTINTVATASFQPDISGTYVLRYSATNAVGTSTDDMTLTVGAIPPVLTRGIVDLPSGDTAYLRVAATNATSLRVKVGTDSALTQGVIFGPAVTPDANGEATLSVSGLVHPTIYYARVEMTDTSGGTSLDTFSTPFRLRAQPTGQYSFSFSLASCTNNVDSVTMGTIAARSTDDFFLHLGDMKYYDGSGATVSNMMSNLGGQMDTTNHVATSHSRPFVYTPSDHDAAKNNSTAGLDPTNWTAWNTTYRRLFAAPGIPATTGVYRTFVWGRVRFIVIDRRSFASSPAATDNSSKTCLGATQKQWLKDTITAATEPVICVVNADPWIGDPVAGDDSWFGYTTERTELANFFAASGKNIFMTAGDMHAVAADDGTNSPGGVALFHAAPMHAAASQKGGTYTVGPIPASGTATTNQYGRCVVTDSGSTISVTFTGYNSSNTQLLSLTKTYSAAPPSVSVNVALSGSGTLSANGVPSVTASPSLTGSSALTATTSASLVRTVALTGTSALTASTSTSLTTNAALSGTGSLSVASTSTSLARAVALSGSGTLTAAATAALTASAPLSGTGTLTAAASPSLTRTAALTGTGETTIGPVERLTPTHRATVATLTSPTVSSWLSGNVALAAGSTVIYSGTVYNGSDVALNARVGVDWKDATASWIGGTGNSATIPAGGTQTITGRGVAIPGTTQFTVTFGFTSTASGQSVTFSGFSVKQDDPPISLTRPVALTGTGTISVTTEATGSATVDVALTGTGSLTATTSPSITRSVALAGSGALTATGTPGLTASGSLSGTGTLTGSGTPSLTLSVPLTGASALSATTVTSITRAVDLTGTGTTTVTTQASGNATVNVALSGSGSLAASTAVDLARSVSLTGTGGLSASAVPSLSLSAALTGTGTLSATSSPTLARTVALSGAGDLTASLSTTLTRAVALAGTGTLTASVNTGNLGEMLYRTAAGGWGQPRFRALDGTWKTTTLKRL